VTYSRPYLDSNKAGGVLVLEGTWHPVVLAIVWAGAAAAIVLKLVWVAAPSCLTRQNRSRVPCAGAAAFHRVGEWARCRSAG
jgi:hypothetical protein